MSVFSLLSTVLSAFTVVSVGFAVVVILVNLLVAGRRSWIMGIVRIIVTVVSAIVALPVTKFAAGKLADMAYDAIVPGLGKDTKEMLEAAPEGLDGVRVLISLITALLLYVVAFLLVRLVLSIIVSIFSRFVPALRKPTRRGIAMPLGALNGLLIVAVILAPICGFLTMGGRVLGDVSTAAEKCDSDVVNAMLDKFGTDDEGVRALAAQIEQQPVIKFVDSTLGRPIFSSLTTGEVTSADGKAIEVNLEQELRSVAGVAVHLTDATDALEKEGFVEEDKNRLYGLVDSIDRSEWLTVLATDALSELAESWKAGESFGGLKCPSMDKAMESSFASLMDVLAHENAETLNEDLHTLFDVLGDFMISGLISGSYDTDQLIKNSSDNQLFEQVIHKLEANPRFAPVADEVRSMSVRLLSGLLGVDELLNGEHADLMQDVSQVLTDMIELEDRSEILRELENTFAVYDYDVPENVAVEMADQIIADLSDDEDKVITPEELTEYLIGHA